MPRVFVFKAVTRISRKEKIADTLLLDAVELAEKGIFRADFGGETYKVDIARSGRGKSHGYRAILGLRTGSRAVYLFLWAKNQFETINDDYLAGLKLQAKTVLDMSEELIETALELGEIREIAAKEEPSDKGGRDEE